MSTDGRDERDGVLTPAPGVHGWTSAHPVATAALRGLVFAILFGVFLALYSSEDPLGVTVAVAAGTGILFGLAMWVVTRKR